MKIDGILVYLSFHPLHVHQSDRSSFTPNTPKRSASEGWIGGSDDSPITPRSPRPSSSRAGWPDRARVARGQLRRISLGRREAARSNWYVRPCRCRLQTPTADGRKMWLCSWVSSIGQQEGI